MDSPRKFYRYVFELEVLSEELLDPSGITLDDLSYETTQGHCSGMMTVKKTEEVSGKRMAKLLKKQGSDPEFFQLDDKGNDVKEDNE